MSLFWNISNICCISFPGFSPTFPPLDFSLRIIMHTKTAFKLWWIWNLPAVKMENKKKSELTFCCLKRFCQLFTDITLKCVSIRSYLLKLLPSYVLKFYKHQRRRDRNSLKQFFFCEKRNITAQKTWRQIEQSEMCRSLLWTFFNPDFFKLTCCNWTSSQTADEESSSTAVHSKKDFCFSLHSVCGAVGK